MLPVAQFKDRTLAVFPFDELETRHVDELESLSF
jgi:hypothetical protein